MVFTVRNKSGLKKIRLLDENGKNIPVRKCVGCRNQKAKSEFIRIVRKANSREVLIDKTHKTDGRGIFSCAIEDEMYSELERMICESE